MKTRIFTLLVALLCLPVISWGQDTPSYGGGDGTSGNPYQISTSEQLKALATAVNGGTNYANTHFQVTADISLNGNEASQWTPIGDENHSFNGTFNGNSKTISGLYIKQTQEKDCVGLFGSIGDNSVIENIIISDSYIGTISNWTAAICGRNRGAIKGCNVTESVTVELLVVLNNASIGGICGTSQPSSSQSIATIENCTNEGTIQIKTESESSSSPAYLGGICGIAQYSLIKNCSNTGNINAIVPHWGINLGGVCGESYTSIENCSNTGNLRFEGCNDYVPNFVGGIVGYAPTKDNAIIKQSYNAGSITAILNGGGAGAWGGYTTIGGISGWSYKEIQSCYNTGDINISGKKLNSYAHYTGGINGMSSNEIAYSYNAGNITTEIPVIIGGIAAQFSSSSANNSFNVGTLKSPYSYVGAISGYDASSTTYSNNGYLANSNLSGYGDGTDKEGMTEMSTEELVIAMNNQLTSAGGWQTTASYSGSTLTLPKLSDDAEEETPTVLVWEDIKVEISPEATDDWYGSEVTLKAPDGFEISLEENGTYAGSVTCSEEGEHELTYYLKSESGAGTHEYTASIKIDLTAPNVEVSTNQEGYTLTLSDGEGSGIASLKIDGVEIDLSELDNGVYSATGTAGEHSYSVTDKAGHETTGTFTLNAEPEEPVIPDYPDYYNIMVEECEGAEVTTSTNVVREGNSVTFTIEVAEGYTAENMEVKFKRSMFGYWETATPDENGTYQIRNIYTDIYIMVKGVAEENPTGIEDIEGAKVYTKEGCIYVYTPTEEQVTIISMSGAIMKNEKQIGLKQYSGLQRGIYIICIGNEQVKVRN